MLPLLSLASAALLFLAPAPGAAHGLVTKPATRAPGAATAAVCGQTMVDFYKSDNTSYPEALKRAHGLDDKGYDASKCNLYLCKGFQYADNTAPAQLQTYRAGDVVPMEVFIRIPHRGFANVSVVDTARNAAIGAPLITWPDNYAASLNPPKDQTQFSVTIPELGGQCTTPGRCVSFRFCPLSVLLARVSNSRLTARSSNGTGSARARRTSRASTLSRRRPRRSARRCLRADASAYPIH